MSETTADGGWYVLKNYVVATHKDEQLLRPDYVFERHLAYISTTLRKLY
jgi:hypothetical protein